MEAAKGGRRVVRAVTGDPGLDGDTRAEEMLACAAEGIPFEVVPGIATAVGVPAYAGVPLRDAQGTDVRFVDARTAVGPLLDRGRRERRDRRRVHDAGLGGRGRR